MLDIAAGECYTVHGCLPSRPDAVIDPWLASLWKNLLTLYPLSDGQTILDSDVL